MTTWHRIGIVNDNIIAQAAQLTLDGEPLLGVRKLTLELDAGGLALTTVTLVMDAFVDVDLPADIAAELEPCPLPHP